MGSNAEEGREVKTTAELIFRRLLEEDVRFVLVGALAATMHGSYLRTSDIDICPAWDPENLERVARVLNELGAQEWDPHKGEAIPRNFTGELLASDPTWILVVDDYRMDLILAPAASEGFEDLAKRAVVVDIGDRELLVASLDDLIRSKEALNRDKDRDHLQVLKRLREASP